MATGKKMRVKDRRKFLRIQQERYLNASRSAKSAMLDAMEADTHLHRKHLIRLMNSDDLRPRKRNRERSRTYGPEVEHAVRLVADALDWPGAERVQPVLADMAHRLDRWVIVAEVIDSHGCAAGHKVGDRLYFSPHGVLEADKSPSRICVQAIPALASAVAVFQERIIAGLPPDPYLFRHVGCVDVGVACGGWGHIAFKLCALPR